MLLAEAPQDRERLSPGPPRLVRIDRGRGGDLARCVNHRDLHAGAKSRIEAHRGARSGGRREQEVAQIAGEHPHSLFFRRLPKPHAQIDGEMPLDARAPSPAHRVVQPFVGGAATVGDVELARDAALVKARAAGRRLRRIFWLEIQIENALFLAAVHREDAVRGHLRKRLRLVEIVGEFRGFGRVLLVVLRLGGEAAAAPHLLAQIADEVCVFAKALHQDRARAFERGSGIGDTLLGIDERRGDSVRNFRRIGEQRVRQRLKPRLFRDLRLRAPLRLIRQIDVFEPRLRIRRHDLRLERIVELALLADRIEDRAAALLQLAQIAEPLLQRAELRVVEHAGDFLAVACDEGHRRAAVQKLDGRLHLLRPHAKLVRNSLFDGFHQSRSAVVAVPPGRLELSRDHTEAGGRFKTRLCNMHGDVALPKEPNGMRGATAFPFGGVLEQAPSDPTTKER